MVISLFVPHLHNIINLSIKELVNQLNLGLGRR